jgi:drug/metabolite transporter (DMT)-like permease
MVCFAVMQLVFKDLSRRGVSPGVSLLFVFAFGTLLYLLHVRASRAPLVPTAPVFGLFAAAAALSYVGNLFSVRAIAEAPNPGYAIAIVGLQAALLTLTSVVVLGASFSLIKAVGVLLCCAGVVLIVGF